MTSGLLETLKEKIKSGGKLFNDLWMSKMSYEEGSYTFEAKHSKKHYLKHSSYVLPVRKILKHSAISGIRLNLPPPYNSPPLFFEMSKNFSKVSKGKSKTDNFPPLFFGKVGSKGGGIKSNTTDRSKYVEVSWDSKELV